MAKNYWERYRTPVGTAGQTGFRRNKKDEEWYAVQVSDTTPTP